MRKISILPIAILGATAVLSTSTIASAEEVTCRSTLGAITVDNLRVPDGATCTLSGTKVKGNITVGAKSVLKATTINVVGNIQAENAKNVVVESNSVIGGSIQIKQSGAAKITNSRINQDLQFEENTAQLAANSNKVGGNLQAFKNTGGLTIRRNRIDGNLQCKENAPAPVGGSNTVAGSKEDQCSKL